MGTRTIVIAKNYEVFVDWRDRNKVEASYVGHPENLMGLNGEEVDVVLLHRWYDNPAADEFLRRRVAGRFPNVRNG